MKRPTAHTGCPRAHGTHWIALILLGDLRAGLADLALVIRLHKVAVSNRAGQGLRADEDIRSVMMFPESSYLNLVQASWFTERVEHLFLDEGIQRFALVPAHFLLLLCLRRR